MSALSDAEVVIVGGGAVGCGVAYSLARAGHRDLLLIERAPDVAQVTSSQGAGLCGQPRDTVERTRLAMHSVATFRELQRDAKVQPEWHEVGSLRVALTAKRAEEFKHLQRVAAEAGLEVELLDRASAASMWPEMNFAEATSILWCPSDGYMRPYAVASSYAYQCRKLGVRFAVSTQVEGVLVENGRVTGLLTNRGKVAARYVINAAGAHAYHIAKLAGLELPIVPVRHEYFVTVAMEGMVPERPCFRVPDMTLYGRPSEGGLLLGGWENQALNLDPRSFLLSEAAPAVIPDLPVLNGFEDQFSRLLPAVKGAERNRVGRGWPTFTPDGRFIIGESRRLRGLVMAGGCNAHGISGSAGIGRLVVETMFDRNPSEYARSLNPDRFLDSAWDWESARRAAARVYETYYGV
ncbi:MAG: FAD-binding oxidoreductase [Verrucomicrobia bacterium]|nr:FAD-binding oxidoreductase [Verrucomicrobiota bacterium]